MSATRARCHLSTLSSRHLGCVNEDESLAVCYAEGNCMPTDTELAVLWVRRLRDPVFDSLANFSRSGCVAEQRTYSDGWSSSRRSWRRYAQAKGTPASSIENRSLENLTSLAALSKSGSAVVPRIACVYFFSLLVNYLFKIANCNTKSGIDFFVSLPCYLHTKRVHRCSKESGNSSSFDRTLSLLWRMPSMLRA